jgi:hypothetical protein
MKSNFQIWQNLQYNALENKIQKKVKPDFLTFLIANFLDVKNVLLFPYAQLNYRNHLRNGYDYLEKVMNWLYLGCLKTNFEGVSAGYSFLRGWEPGYVETTGYIIGTMIEYGKMRQKPLFTQMAIKMADWLIKIQLNCGGFQGLYGVKAEPVVFNTGQDIFGLVDVFRITGNNKYLESAKKAAYWLMEVQQANGSWTKHDSRNIAHSYNTRTSWAMLELYKESHDEKIKKSAIKNLEWTYSNRNNVFWLRFNNFDRKTFPLTHTIAYSIRGFLESGLILTEQKYVDFALNAAQKVLDQFFKDKFIYATYNHSWVGKDSYVCITGDAQLSYIWMKLYLLTKNPKFLIGAYKINDFLRWIQQKWKNISILTRDSIQGAMQCSYPIWGNYLPFHFSNWTAKFYADTLMLEEQIAKQKQR